MIIFKWKIINDIENMSELIIVLLTNFLLTQAGKSTDHLTHSTRWLDNIFTSFLENNNYPGANLGVMVEGKLQYIQSYGKTQDGQSIHPGTIFPISSLSKLLTSVAIMKLIEQGKLTLNETIFNSDGILHYMVPMSLKDSRIRDITVSHLLQHSAGWDHTKPPLYDPMMNVLYQTRHDNIIDIAKDLGVETLTPVDIISYMLNRTLDYTPGMFYHYSNFGYCILGRIIEVISGQSYNDFVTNEIVTPLGMWHTQIGSKHSSNNKLLYDYPTHLSPGLQFDEGYISVNDIPVYQIHDAVSPEFLDSTLGWYSNVYDIMRLISALDGSGNVQILQPETVRLMLQKPIPPMPQHVEQWFACGLHVHNNGVFWIDSDPHDNDLLLWHSGIKHFKSRIQRSQSKVLNQCWIVYFHGHQHKHLRHFLVPLFNSDNITWPTNDYFLHDLSDSHMLKRKIIKLKISEKHFPAYINALQNLDFIPSWISTYNFEHGTYFTLIGHKKSPTDEVKLIKSGLNRIELSDLQRDMALEGYTTTFIASYVSYYHGYNIKYAVIFSQIEPKTYVGNEIPIRDYLQHLKDYKNKNFVVKVQNIITYDNEQYASFILQHAETVSDETFTYYNLSLDELESTIKTNSINSQNLAYLDAYSESDKNKFSAIFDKQQLKQWIIRNLMTKEDVKKESKIMENNNYSPYIIVGYELNHKLLYSIGWIRS